MNILKDLKWLLLILTGNVAISLLNIKSIVDSQRWVSHTYAVREQIDGVSDGMVQSESGYRGYLLTHEDDFLDPYRDGARRVQQCLDRLKVLTADNPVQQQNVPVLKQATADKLHLIDLTIRAGQQHDAPEVTRLVHAGRIAQSRVRLVCQQMLSEEDRLMRERNDRLRYSYSWMIVNTVCYSALVGVALLLLATRR